MVCFGRVLGARPFCFREATDLMDPNKDLTPPGEAIPPPAPLVVTKKKAALGTAWIGVEFASDQGLRMIRSVFLTHMISQHMFGLLGLASIVVAFVSAFSDFGGNIAIMRKRRNSEQRFLNTAWTLSILRGLSVWLVVCAAAYPAMHFYGEPSLLIVVPAIGFCSVITSAYSTKIATMNRDLLIGRVTVLKSLTRLIGLLATISWAWFAPDNLGVILIGPILSVALMLAASFLFLPGPNNRFAYDREAAKEILKFGKWIFVSTALTFLVRKGDILIVGRLVPTEQFAVYNIAYMIANVFPTFFLALSGRIIFPIYANLQDKPVKAVRHKVFKMRRVLLLTAVPVLWMITLFGRHIVHLLYPDSYSDAGWMLELYAAGTIGLIISTSSGGVLLAKGDSFQFMLVRAIRGGLMLLGMWLGFMLGAGGLFDSVSMGVAVLTSQFLETSQPLIDWATANPDAFRPDLNDGVRGLILGMGLAYWLSYIQLAREIHKHGIWQPRLDLPLFAASALIVAIRLLVP